MRRIGFVGGATAATTGGAPLRSLRRALRPRRVLRRRIRIKAPGTIPAVTPTNKATILRMHKAVARMRRAMQTRLRWRPRPEVVVAEIEFEAVIANPRGRITGPGLLWGKVTDG